MTRKFTHPRDAGPDHPGWVTINGKEAIIYNAEGTKNNFIHGAIVGSDGLEQSMWREDGAYMKIGETPFDLQDAPRKFGAWINIYSSRNSVARSATKEDADAIAGPDRIACVKVEWVEGEGLE